jgi:hypothetical protein
VIQTQPRQSTDLTLDNSDTTQQAVVHVANPTGSAATDVANIQAAIAGATPGALIQFAPGTYRIRETTQIFVTTPGVTLQGHPLGTTIRGTAAVSLFFLGHFRLLGGHQTVRNLTFRDFTAALTIGDPGSPVGGYRVENSRFRHGSVGINYVTLSDDVSRIRNNEFIDMGLPFVILGKTVHFTGNRTTAPDPASVVFGQPLSGGILGPDLLFRICENNLFEGNTTIGNADGFIVLADAAAGEICTNNVFRGNVFRDQRVFTNGDNGSLLWAPGSGVRENLIAENALRGSEGVGIVIEEGKRNRIVGNDIRNLPGAKDVANPFPGTAIFLGERSRGNRVLENEFTNVVRTVVDLGTNNVVQSASVAASGQLEPRPAGNAAPDNTKLRLLRQLLPAR